MSFPSFPSFRRFYPEDKLEYLAYYQQFEPYSDFSFNNLLNWLDFYHDLEVSQHNANLVFRFSNVLGDTHQSYTILGKTSCLATAKAVFAFQKEQGRSQILTMVPLETLQGILLENSALPKDLVIRFESSNSDYIFSIRNNAAMRGKVFADLRNKLNSFKSKHRNKNIYTQQLDLRSQMTQQLLTGKLTEWGSVLSFYRNDPRLTESVVIKRYLEAARAGILDAGCLGIYIQDRLVSFCIYQLLPQKGWVIVNHIKCEPTGYKNLFLFTRYTLIKHLVSLGLVYENGEQDLSLAGLRATKLHQRPIRYLCRYEVTKLDSNV